VPAGSAGIDLNADVGELDPLTEAPLYSVVTTVHVACGGHTGDARSMAEAVEAALSHGVTVGAHPSYPDRAGFGRVPLDRSPRHVGADIVGQVASLVAVADAAGTAVRSVKPHGALYHRMADDPDVAAAIADAVDESGDGLVLVAPAGSVAIEVARARGVAVVTEGFCDRAYRRDGRLVDRSEPDAVVTDASVAARRALALAVDGSVETVDGFRVQIDCDTLCVHGDTPGAGSLARAVRRALEDAGVGVRPFVDVQR
jgi:5-oxoprolinase (ATP-hydrolysing) subunit A